MGVMHRGGPEERRLATICVEYRRLNSKMVPDEYPLPRIDDCLDSLIDAENFMTLCIISPLDLIRVCRDPSSASPPPPD